MKTIINIVTDITVNNRIIGYILVMGIPNLKPELFAWEYNSENVSLTPALINTVLMTAFSLAISTPLGIFAAIWLVEYILLPPRCHNKA